MCIYLTEISLNKNCCHFVVLVLPIFCQPFSTHIYLLICVHSLIRVVVVGMKRWHFRYFLKAGVGKSFDWWATIDSAISQWVQSRWMECFGGLHYRRKG